MKDKTQVLHREENIQFLPFIELFIIYYKIWKSRQWILLIFQGTQFIEDFNTQQDLRGPINVDDEDDTIHYDKHLYATQQREQTSRRSSSFTTGGKAKANHDDINGEGKFIGEARNDGKDTLLSSEKHRQEMEEIKYGQDGVLWLS